MNSSIVSYNVSTNLTLSARLLQLDDQFERAASQNFESALNGDTDTYTDAERRAIVKFEKLKLIGNLGLTEILLRGKVLDEIEQEGLWTILPGGHPTLEAAAKAQGVGIGTLSFIKDLTRIVFPYLVNFMGMDLARMWEEIGSSNFRELLPVLKRIISGEASTSDQVNESAEMIIENVVASAQSSGTQFTTEQIQQMAVGELLEMGQLPVREVRTRLRPERQPMLHAIVVESENRRYVFTEVNPDQWLMLQRKMTGCLEVQPVSTVDLRNIPLYSNLCDLGNG